MQDLVHAYGCEMQALIEMISVSELTYTHAHTHTHTRNRILELRSERSNDIS